MQPKLSHISEEIRYLLSGGCVMYDASFPGLLFTIILNQKLGAEVQSNHHMEF